MMIAFNKFIIKSKIQKNIIKILNFMTKKDLLYFVERSGSWKILI